MKSMLPDISTSNSGMFDSLKRKQISHKIGNTSATRVFLYVQSK